MVACLLVGAAGTAQAQQKAYSVKISDKIVRMEIQLPDSHSVKVAVHEGEQARITDRELKLDMAFIPVRQDGGVRVRVFRIETHPSGDESMHFVEDIDTKIGDAGYTKKAGGAFTVRVLEVKEPSARSNE